MARISDLSDELLVKIISFLPTKVAVSTSILSKQWEFLWMWCPDLQFYCNRDLVRDFINRNLPLHKSPIIKSFNLTFDEHSLQAEQFKSWVEIAVSRGIRNLTVLWYTSIEDPVSLFIPKSLYTSNTLVTLELVGKIIVVDVPRKVCLNSLKKLLLKNVTYSNGDSLPLLLSYCPVLEDLLIYRKYYDNVGALVITIPSLLRLSLEIDMDCDDGWCKIITPALRYFEINDERKDCSYLLEHMPKLEEADISVDNDSTICLGNLLKSVSVVKSLSLNVDVKTGNEIVNGVGNIFSKLESLKLTVCARNWSKVTFHLLKDSPKLQELDLKLEFFNADVGEEAFGDDEPVGWISDQSLVPDCLLSSLETFEFYGSTKEEEEKEFLCFIIKHARCLESTSICRAVPK